MLGLFKRAPKLVAVFRPTVAVARELTREVEVAGELVLRNLGRAAELTDLELVLIGGGTRRIDLAVPEAWRGRLQLAAGGELTAGVGGEPPPPPPQRAPAAGDPGEHPPGRAAPPPPPAAAVPPV